MSQTFADNLLPSATGLDLGSASQQWDAFLQNLTISGALTSTGTFAITKLEDIRFADQFAGGSVTAKIDAAVTDANNAAYVLIPSSMGAGFGSLGANVTILDMRDSTTLKLFTAGNSTPLIQFSPATGIFAQAFVSNTANPASSGQVRLAKTDSIQFRNSINTGDIRALSQNSNALVIGDPARNINFTGAVADFSTFSSFLAASSTDFSMTTLIINPAGISMVGGPTLVPNWNSEYISNVQVSQVAPTSGQVLTATSAVAANWQSVTSGGYSFNATNKRWELKDNTITGWVVDAKPGFVFDVLFGPGAFVDENATVDARLIAGGVPWKQTLTGAGTWTTGSENLNLTTGSVANNLNHVTLVTINNLVETQYCNSMLFVFDPIQTDANTTHRMGLGTTIADPPNTGIYLECLGADTNWQLVTRNGGTQTRTDTGVARAAGKTSWVITVTTTSVSAYQVGTAAAKATSTTNIPAAANTMGPIFTVKTLTGAPKQLALYNFRLVGIQVGY